VGNHSKGTNTLELLDSEDLDGSIGKNSPEPRENVPLQTNPYSGITQSSKVRIRPCEEGKWTFKNDASEPIRSKKKIMEAECMKCTCFDPKEIRECMCLEYPFWMDRERKSKVQRAYFGKFKKAESLNEAEQAELESLRQSIPEAQARVLKQATMHCSRQVPFFEKAFGGKSRANAIKSYQLYMANFHASEIETIGGGNQP
jgi:hypothetical protein